MRSRSEAVQPQISWHAELIVRPGQLPAFLALTEEMVTVTRRESGALAYQRFITADRGCVHVYERYRDSDAALEHLHVFRERFAERFGALVERKRFTVFGEPSVALRHILDSVGATYCEPFGDLPYWADRP
jgi:quinol monooxygenase YgiN